MSLAGRRFATLVGGGGGGDGEPATSGAAAGSGASTLEDELSQPFIVEVTRATFEKEVLNSKRPVIVDFYADWCVIVFGLLSHARPPARRPCCPRRSIFVSIWCATGVSHASS